MKEPPPARIDGRARFSAALKGIRRLRNLTSAETAGLMNLSPRAYERFEAGQTRPNRDYVFRFARVTNSDPHAIFVAVAIGAPEFAVHCARNQMVTIMTNGLEDLAQDLGPDLAFLTARDALEILTPMFEALAARARANRDLQARIADQGRPRG